jgi:hypothetical protein
LVRVGCLGRGPPANWPGAPGPLGIRCPGPPGAPVGLRSKMGLPRCSPVAGAGAVCGTMDALYTGRGPVCGITMRRAGGSGARSFGLGAAAVNSAAMAATEDGGSAIGARVSAAGAAARGSATVAAGGSPMVGATGACAFAAGFSAPRGCSSRTTGAAGGLATTAPGAGGTTTTARAPGTVPAGGFATTVPAGGRLAIAGAAGGSAMIGGAERGCGTIRRGSGRAGTAAAGITAAGATAGVALGAVRTSGLAGCAGAAGFTGTLTWRASSSSSCFLARTAFSTSPGFEMCDRSIFGTMVGSA